MLLQKAQESNDPAKLAAKEEKERKKKEAYDKKQEAESKPKIQETQPPQKSVSAGFRAALGAGDDDGVKFTQEKERRPSFFD